MLASGGSPSVAVLLPSGQMFQMPAQPAVPQPAYVVYHQPYFVVQQQQQQQQQQATLPSQQALAMTQLLNASMVPLQRQGTGLGDKSSGSDHSTDSTGVVCLPKSEMLRVRGDTRVDGLAGAIAKRLRGEEHVVAAAMGPSSVVCCMRALVLANHFLQGNNLCVSLQIAFRIGSGESASQCGGVKALPGLSFEVQPAHIDKAPRPESVTQWVSVSDVSQPGKTAGAVAKLARKLAESQSVFCVWMKGDPAAFNTAVKAIVLARRKLDKDDIDLRLYVKEPCADVDAPLELLVMPYDKRNSGSV